VIGVPRCAQISGVVTLSLVPVYWMWCLWLVSEGSDHIQQAGVNDNITAREILFIGCGVCGR
jgi:hypothetical protein